MTTKAECWEGKMFVYCAGKGILFKTSSWDTLTSSKKSFPADLGKVTS